MEIWSGTWKTQVYKKFLFTYCHGTIETELPVNLSDIDENEQIDFTITIIYKGYYRYNDIEKHNFKFKKSDIDKETNTLKLSKSYHFGTIHFNLLFNNNKIDGVYSLSNPYDYGTFELRKEDDQLSSNTSYCNIL